ncbi:MAG: ankyrin repeat domain-containing protein [Armatimonas sp.]
MANIAIFSLLLIFVVYNIQHKSEYRNNTTQNASHSDTISVFLTNSDDVEEFKKLLRATPDGSKANIPMLEDAIRNNRTQCLTYLLDSNPQIEKPGSLVSAAVNYNHTECVKILIRKGFPVDFETLNSFLPIHYAAVSKDRIESLKLLLDSEANINREISPSNLTLSGISLKSKKFKDRYKRYYRDDLSNIPGNTPLFTAITYGNLDGAKLLIQRGCNLDIKNHEGMTALDWIAYIRKNSHPGYFLPEPAMLAQMKELILEAKRKQISGGRQQQGR